MHFFKSLVNGVGGGDLLTEDDITISWLEEQAPALQARVGPECPHCEG